MDKELNHKRTRRSFGTKGLNESKEKGRRENESRELEELYRV